MYKRQVSGENVFRKEFSKTPGQAYVQFKDGTVEYRGPAIRYVCASGTFTAAQVLKLFDKVGALEKANKEFYGKAFVKFINVWDYPDAANNVPVQVIPTQVLFNADGTPFVPSEELAKKIQFDMYSHRDTGEHIFTVHQGGLTEEQMWEFLKEMGVE